MNAAANAAMIYSEEILEELKKSQKS
jgi:hypothetical protein